MIELRLQRLNASYFLFYFQPDNCTSLGHSAHRRNQNKEIMRKAFRCRESDSYTQIGDIPCNNLLLRRTLCLHYLTKVLHIVASSFCYLHKIISIYIFIHDHPNDDDSLVRKIIINELKKKYEQKYCQFHHSNNSVE